ncbi:MAG: alpha/beta fold hydrolase [Reyranella sp.]|nr:alpha/beta fold hydrolase [Reyranella sp.]
MQRIDRSAMAAAQTKNRGDPMSNVKKVTFKSGGLSCAADLYLPSGLKAGARLPALVLGHGFSIVRSMLKDQAEGFCKAGYIVLAIDYRSFGDSEGEPRGQLFPLQEAEDFRNAISYIQEHKNVDADRIGIWGTSFGGAMVTYVGAIDRRAKAVVAQVPVTDGYIWMRLQRSEQHFVELLDAVDADRERRRAGKPGARMPVAGKAGEICGMPFPEETLKFFDELPKAHPTWKNSLALESVEKILEFSPLHVVDRISPRPYLIVTTSGYDIVHPAWSVADLYERARSPKSIAWLPYDQMGLYSEPGMSESVKVATEFFNEHLKR